MTAGSPTQRSNSDGAQITPGALIADTFGNRFRVVGTSPCGTIFARWYSGDELVGPIVVLDERVDRLVILDEEEEAP